MSLLWSGVTLMTRLTHQRKPSPTRQKDLQDSAQNPGNFPKGAMGRQDRTVRSIEGISLSTSLSGEVCASMTVEASVLLPLFLLFFLNLGCAMELIRLHGNLQLALWQTGSRLALYGYVLDSGEAPEDGAQEDGWWKGLAGTALVSGYVKSQLIDTFGREYLEQSPLADGADSLRMWESEIFGSGDEIDIVVTYQVSPWSSLAGFAPFRMANRYYAHIWNGYQLPNAGDEESAAVTVFLTPNGSVYHLDRDCTHLRLSVRQISSAELDSARNQSGSRYQPCGKCADGSPPAVLFITAEGDCYHYGRECSGLKRTVYSMSLSEAAASYRPCSRCGMGP